MFVGFSFGFVFVFVGFGGCALVFGVCCLICYCSPCVCVWVFVAVHLCMVFCVWGLWCLRA